MANLFSFTTAGATPKQGYLGGPTIPASPLGYGTTPASKALSNAPSFPGGSPALASTVNNAISAVKPTTAVKKVNNVDGSSTEYHAPAKGMTVEEYQAAVAAKNQPSSSGMIQAGTNQPSNNTGSQPMSNPTPTYPGLISSLTQNALAGSPVAGQAASGLLNLQNDKKVEDARGKLAKQIGVDKQGIADIYSDPIPLEFQQGRAQVAQNLAAEREGVLQQQLSNVLEERGQNITGLTSAGNLGNTAQGQLQSGLTSAGNLASPLQLPYSNQLVNPTNGQAVNGGASGSLQDAVSQITQRIQSGQMSYDQGVQALQGYGQGGTNALQQALGPNFNIAQSNALAGQQGTIGPAYSYAKTALTNLQNAVSGLSGTQSTNIPIINMITQGLSTTFGVGSQGVQAYKGALAEARSAIQKVLASVQGGTPTDYVGQSNALLPDNATPNQIAAASQTLDTLGQAKVDIYGNPGASNTNSNAQSNPPGWF